MELVQEIHQVLMDREETCHRTCFSLQLDGVTLDNFAELKSIENLKEGSVIKVVEGMASSIHYPILKQALVFTCLQNKSSENLEGKGEIACNKQFLLIRQCFLPFRRTFCNFRQI